VRPHRFIIVAAIPDTTPATLARALFMEKVLTDFNVVVIDTEDRFVGTGFTSDIVRASVTIMLWFIVI
jgi:Mg-chelatase subunit ChlD